MTRTSYSAGHFALTFDGSASSAYLKSVEGGEIHREPISESVGTSIDRIKHLSVNKVEPFAIEFGVASAWPVMQWVQSSWKRDYSRMNGSITHADFDLKSTFEHDFTDALILETSFPELNGASKDPYYVKVKFQPENVRMKMLKEGGAKISATSGAKQKMWLPNAFRLNIDGVEKAEYTNKIEAFTIKQSIKESFSGEDLYAAIEPTKLEFPDLTCTISMAYADGIFKWYEKSVVNAGAAHDCERTGSIEFLAPNRSDVAFRINLSGVGIKRATILPATANEDQIKRMKFELYVSQMQLDGKGAGFD